MACVSLWIRRETIEAARSRDVQARRDDDRSRAWRREESSRALAEVRLSRPPKFRFTFGAQVKAKSPRPKRERTGETRAYFREYMRARRARDRDKMADGEIRHVD